MTIQEKKEFLQRYQSVNADIQQMEEELRVCREKAMKTMQALPRLMIDGRCGNRMRLAVERIIETEARLDRRLEELCRVLTEIEEAIEKLESPVLRRLLQYRYITGLSWEAVAEKMHYGMRHAVRLHQRGLQELPL